MKFRIVVWAILGFGVAAGWALYAFAAVPPALTFGDPIMILVRLTCPVALVTNYPLQLSWVLLANAVTYALIGLIVETLRRQLHLAK